MTARSPCQMGVAGRRLQRKVRLLHDGRKAAPDRPRRPACGSGGRPGREWPPGSSFESSFRAHGPVDVRAGPPGPRCGRRRTCRGSGDNRGQAAPPCCDRRRGRCWRRWRSGGWPANRQRCGRGTTGRRRAGRERPFSVSRMGLSAWPEKCCTTRLTCAAQGMHVERQRAAVAVAAMHGGMRRVGPGGVDGGHLVAGGAGVAGVAIMKVCQRRPRRPPRQKGRPASRA